MMAFLMSNCDKARPGWPCDASMEKMRDSFVRAASQDERRRIAEAAQTLNAQIVTQIPLGEFWNVSATRGNIVSGETSSMVTVYWGIDKK